MLPQRRDPAADGSIHPAYDREYEIDEGGALESELPGFHIDPWMMREKVRPEGPLQPQHLGQTRRFFFCHVRVETDQVGRRLVVGNRPLAISSQTGTIPSTRPEAESGQPRSRRSDRTHAHAVKGPPAAARNIKVENRLRPSRPITSVSPGEKG